MLLLYAFIRRHVITRLIRLEKYVKDYADNKDNAISAKIRTVVTEEDELSSLSERFAVMIDELEDYMKDLQAVTAEKERIGAELNVAAQIQADMLPRIFPPFPEWPEVDLFATMTPAKEVGGDFYDFFMIDDKHMGMVIADVSSKGVPAALFMVIAKTLIKNSAQTGEDIAKVFCSVNNQLCEGNEESMFVTAFLAVIDISTGMLTYVNAGHEPFLHRHDGSWSWVRPDPGFILAGLPDFEYHSESLQIHPSDRLFFFTDGVSESQNVEGTLFGEERILETVSKNGGHLASNLGVVELTIALHRVFHSPQDKIIWDVSHQSYVHKLLTGRADRFDSIRLPGGISGFTRRSESEHDIMSGGHS